MAYSNQQTTKKELKKKYLVRRSIVTVLCFTIIASSALIITSCGNKEGSSSDSDVTVGTTSITTEATTTEAPEPVLTLLPGIQERLDKNPDSAGWINIDGIVDEEIVQRQDPTTGNLFYLDHDLNGNKSEGGTIFADFRNVLNGRKTSDNIVLYGHNQKNGTRFGLLDSYKWNLNFYKGKNKQIINFSTNYEERKYKIFAIFVTNTEPQHDNGNVFDYHNYIDLSDDSRYNEFISEVKKRSLIQTDIDVKKGDKFLTLSTCSTEFEPSRLVFVARQLRDGETTDVNLDNFKINPNPKWPAIYYKFHGGSYVEGN